MSESANPNQPTPPANRCQDEFHGESLVSVVVPVYNEGENIQICLRQIEAALQSLPESGLTDVVAIRAVALRRPLRDARPPHACRRRPRGGVASSSWTRSSAGRSRATTSRRSSAASPVLGGCRPAEPRCLRCSTNWMRPASMPMPATPNPNRQLMVSPTQPQKIGAIKAPVLIPM